MVEKLKRFVRVPSESELLIHNAFTSLLKKLENQYKEKVKMQKKILPLIMLVAVFLAIAATPRAHAQLPTISLTPVSGPVGSIVTVNGTGFTPDTTVGLSWNTSVTGDFVGVGNGETTEFPLFFGIKYIISDSEKIYVDSVLQTRDVDYTIDYSAGILNFTVPPPAGMLQAVVITADYDIMIVLAMTTTDGSGNFTTTLTVPESYAGAHDVWAVSNETTPDIATASYTVEPQIVLSSTKGPPQAWITVTGTGYAANEEVDIYALSPGHPGGGVFELTYANVTTDAYGTFAEAIALPSSFNVFDALMAGDAAVPIAIWAQDTSGNLNITFYLAVLWCESEPSSIDVDVEVGELYFLGEVLTVHALTSVDGVPTDVDDIEFLVYRETLGPMPVSQLLSIVHVDTGLYAVTTTLMGDTNPGNYLIKVEASKSTYWEGEQVDLPWFDLWYTHFDLFDPDIAEAWGRFGGEYEGFWPITIHGVGIEGFIISPTLAGMNARLTGIEGDIATINTNIGLIQLNLTAINATLTGIQGDLAIINSTLGEIEVKLDDINATLVNVQGDLAIINSTLGEIEVKLDDINATLVALNGTVATVQTDIDTIQTDISNIELAIASIEDDIATIDTTLGTIQGRITSVEGNTATIETDVGTVKADVSDVKGTQESFTIPLYTTTILALLAAVGTIILLVMHLRR